MSLLPKCICGFSSVCNTSFTGCRQVAHSIPSENKSNMSDKQYSDLVPHDQPPSYNELIEIIEKNFKNYLKESQAFTEDEIEAQWQRYKALNRLYQSEIPPMRPEDHEQVDVNIAAGMPENEASFQAGFTAGHDAGYEKGKRESAGVGAAWVHLGNPWPQIHKTYIFRKHQNNETARVVYVNAYTLEISQNGKFMIENAMECDMKDIEWLDESGAAQSDEHPHQSLFDQYHALKEKIGKLGYNTFIHSKEVEEYREWLRNERYKHRIEWFEKEYPNGLYSKDDDGELFGINIMTKKFLADADAAYEAAQSGKEDAVAFGKWLKVAQWQDGDRKQAFMKNNFEKLYDIFKQKSK